MDSATQAPPPARRLIALDVFRGMTIAAMILVNNPGNWGAIYAPLRHADWHGWTPTDLVFPFFLFIVGVAIVLALRKRLAGGMPRRAVWLQVLRRGAILFALGLLLNAFPFVRDFLHFEWKDFSQLRIPGVLQRIAVCYVVVSLLFLHCRLRTLWVVTVFVLLLYWVLMMWVPVPGHGAGLLDQKSGNLAAWIDRQVLGEHVWAYAKTWDPEGILSTLPALATTLFGVFTGLWIAGAARHEDKVLLLVTRGACLVIVGYVWDWFFPINKNLWTSSYAVFTAGQAMCGLGLCIFFIDVRGHSWFSRPFVVYGVNALTVFVMSGLIGRLLHAFRWQDAAGRTVTLKSAIFDSCFTSWIGDPQAASLAFALTWIVGWFVVLAAMYRRGWIIKI